MDIIPLFLSLSLSLDVCILFLISIKSCKYLYSGFAELSQ